MADQGKTMDANLFEVAVPEGLESIAYDELRSRLGGQEKLLHPPAQWPGVLQFAYSGRPAKLLQLKCVLSLYSNQHFAVPRPLALMGHQNFQAILRQIGEVISLTPRGAYQTLHLAAAGSDSNVMARFASEIAAQFALEVVQGDGDLLVRVRHPLDGSAGWDVLVRMSPRPLSARKWRVCDFEGALNAAVAQAVALLTRPSAEDNFLNLACGSGTLLVERAAAAPARRLIGCDVNQDALRCARENIAASGNAARIQVYPWDARNLPLVDGSINVVCADLPFGLDVGSHLENVTLYPEILKEAARVTRPGGRAVLLTHEIRLMTSLLEAISEWSVEDVTSLAINGLHPRIFRLKRNTAKQS
jgi:tRNA (guanine6-N2)-methyltransferase